MPRLTRIVLGLGLLATLTYTGDYLSIRIRVAYDRDPFEALEIQRVHAIRKKNGKYEIMVDEPVLQTCVHTLFPHLGYEPCWYLARHTHQQVIYD